LSVKYPTNPISLANPKGFGGHFKLKKMSLMEALENMQSYYCFDFQMNVKVVQVLHIRSKPRQIWTSIDTQEKTLHYKNPVDLKALHHDCQIRSSSLFWSGKECILARQKHFDKGLSEITFIKGLMNKYKKIERKNHHTLRLHDKFWSGIQVSWLWEYLKIQMLCLLSKLLFISYFTSVVWGTVFQKIVSFNTCCIVLIFKFVQFSAISFLESWRTWKMKQTMIRRIIEEAKKMDSI